MSIDHLWGTPATNPTTTGAEPQVSPTPNTEQAPTPGAPTQTLPPVTDQPQLPPATPQRKQSANPIVKWFQDMREDMAARKERGDGWLAARWMGEQPTSVRDYLHYYLHERHERADGRKGWGLTTEALLIDEGHALLYQAYGLTIGLAFTLIGYGGAWMGQRPGRASLLLAALILIVINLVIWLSAG